MSSCMKGLSAFKPRQHDQSNAGLVPLTLLLPCLQLLLRKPFRMRRQRLIWPCLKRRRAKNGSSAQIANLHTVLVVLFTSCRILTNIWIVIGTCCLGCARSLVDQAMIAGPVSRSGTPTASLHQLKSLKNSDAAAGSFFTDMRKSTIRDATSRTRS